jgi:hypothetical protein
MRWSDARDTREADDRERGLVDMLGRFNKVFGIQDDVLTEQRRFVERINQSSLPEIENLRYPVTYQNVFAVVCYWLGTNANDRISKANQGNYFSSETFVPPLRSLTLDDFRETLKVLSLLYSALNKAPAAQQTLSRSIEVALSNATVDLGVTWTDGMFYPSGARELDEPLVEETFKWLADFPNEKADYLKAVTSYASKQFGEVITRCYVAVEGVARNILGNSRTLDNNREALMEKLGLSQEWKALLSNFIRYANEFQRHASENRHNLNPIEVEGFLYMTGVLLRMMILAAKTK